MIAYYDIGLQRVPHFVAGTISTSKGKRPPTIKSTFQSSGFLPIFNKIYLY